MHFLCVLMERIYATFDRIFEFLPEQSLRRDSLGFLLLMIANIAIALADLAAGYSVSLGACYGVTLIISAMYLSEAPTYALMLLCTLLRVGAFSSTTLIEPDLTTIALNAIPVLFFYLLLSHFACTAVGTIRTLSEQVRLIQRNGVRRL